MVVIRLARGGSKKRPFYQVVVADSRRSATGKFIENLGYFNPGAQGQASRLELKTDRIGYWVGKGAQPSERVTSLLKENTKAAA
ncbi:MAG: 30S ribosomal protein S16 [Pseudomonadota bacterium]